MNKLFSVLLMVICLTLSVSALGITPGRTTLNFNPGIVQEIPFSVINSEDAPIEVVLVVQGVLNESISLSDVSFELASGETKSLTYFFDTPATLPPGRHTAEIIALQLPSRSSGGQTFVGATVGVATQLYVNVPYPGKFVETELHIGDSQQGGKTFVLPLVSRGDLDIVRAHAIIEIFGALNEKIIQLETNQVSLLSGERKEIVAEWDGAVPPGTYRAVATVLYDEEIAVAETRFNIGNRLLELGQVVVNDFTLGGIAKFEMLVENSWGEDIEDAYAQMQIYNEEGAVIADFKSATYTIPSLGKELIVAFWDTDGVREGTYEASVFLHYSEQASQQDLELEVSERSINVVGLGYVISNAEESDTNSLIVILVSIIGVLVLVNILWFLVLRKRLHK